MTRNTNSGDETTTPPIINCHIHTFTKDHIPPWLGKSIIPWPFYYLLYLPLFLALFKSYTKLVSNLRYRSSEYRKFKRILYSLRMPFFRIFPLVIFRILVTVWALMHMISFVRAVGDLPYAWMRYPFELLQDLGLWLDINSLPYRLIFMLLALIFIPSIRQITLALLKQIKGIGWAIPDEETKNLMTRYVNMGRYAIYERQTDIFRTVRSQYPQNTLYVVLPMDMKFMKAGSPKKGFDSQMKELNKMYVRSKQLRPFIFVDPRRDIVRLEEPKIKGNIHSIALVKSWRSLAFWRKRETRVFFDYRIENDRILLNDCYFKDYIEDKKFRGIKIYPSLGYFPFDAKLLPVWAYAVENDIPILTHCTKGTIYYRGKKKREWDQHVVFREQTKKSDNNHPDSDDKNNAESENEENENGVEMSPLLLQQVKNVDYSNNFIHPLNFLCLLEEDLLKRVLSQVKKSSESERNPDEKKALEKILALYGFKGEDQPLKRNLKKLKICIAHYGGTGEWQKHLDADRDTRYTRHIYKAEGLDFMHNRKGELSDHKLSQIWRETDWYTIISGLMMQYENVYADISFTLHDTDIIPLLRSTLDVKRPILRSKVLFGTDFYMVRNQKSDRQIFAEIKDLLTDEEFDLISKVNPIKYLGENK